MLRRCTCNIICIGRLVHQWLFSCRCTCTHTCLPVFLYWTTVELQWLEHWWLVYHVCFEFVLECLGKNPIASDIIIIGIIKCDFLFYIENDILCVPNRLATSRRFCWVHPTYLHIKENRKRIPIVPPDLALWLTLISSNYPYLKHIFMVLKMFEPLKCCCIF